MKRDMDLIRQILQAHEAERPLPKNAFSEREILYHYKLLEDAGLITAGLVAGDDDVPVAVGWVRITWAGHDFLDASRDGKLWQLAKTHVFKPGASWTFQTLLVFLRREIERRFLGGGSPPP